MIVSNIELKAHWEILFNNTFFLQRVYKLDKDAGTYLHL